MDYRLILVASSEQKPLTITHLQDVESLLQSTAVVFDEVEWLHHHKAASIALSTSLNDEAFMSLRDSMARYGHDVFEVPVKDQRKKLLLADMDATIVEGETLDDLAGCIGIKEEIAAITARAMRGELDFHQALTERVARLKDVPMTALSDTLAQMKINEGAARLIRVMRFYGAECYLVSGGFTYFTEAISRLLGFTGHHGNVLENADGRLTGRVIPPILDKDAKKQFLGQYRQSLGLKASETMAVGDGANDIPMLLEAGTGIGFRPKPLVKEAIRNSVIHTDLTSLLYIQGYTWHDIVAADQQ